MKRIIKSIKASTLTSDVKYLMGDPDDEYALEGYGDGYKVVTFDEIIEDMVSDIQTDDLIIRVIDKRSRTAQYTLASKRGRDFSSYYEEFDEILDALPIKEKPEYDVTTKTIYTTYGRSWSYTIDCAELPKDIFDGWVQQRFDLDGQMAKNFEDAGFDIASLEDCEEFLLGMLQNGDVEGLSPSPEDLF